MKKLEGKIVVNQYNHVTKLYKKGVQETWKKIITLMN